GSGAREQCNRLNAAVERLDELVRGPAAPVRMPDDCRNARQRTRCQDAAMRLRRLVGYSITSSASVSSLRGMSSLSALAVLRLMTNSNLVGCITGRSAGFSPLRIRTV